jgi:DNA-binding Xre family transcriptional regulator
MKISYDNLWKILVDKKMKKKDLKESTGLSPASIAKLSKAEPVSLVVLYKICCALECNIEDVIEFIYEKNN